MCSHTWLSYTKQPIARIDIIGRDSDQVKWLSVMQKAHLLAYKRQQQEAVLDIQQEIEIEQLIYPQSFISLKKAVISLSKNKILKIKTASSAIKTDLAAAARMSQCKVESILNERYLYLTKIY